MMRMMRKASVAAAMLLVACASGAGRGGSNVNQLLRRAGSLEADPPRDGSEYFVVDTVVGTRERAFNAVRYTYEELGIPFTYYDPDRHEMGGFVERLGDIDEQPPSTWLECGHGVVAGNNANLYYVSLAIGTRVLAVDSTRSTIETVLRARSHERDAQSSMTRCGTRGTLEERIADGALRLLLRYGPSGGVDAPGG